MLEISLSNNYQTHAKEINHAIRQWCGIQDPQRNHAWWNLFYNTINQGLFFIKGSITGPDGRQYVAAHLCSDHMIDGIIDPATLANPPREDELRNMSPAAQSSIVYSFSGLCGYAYDRIGGIAIVLGDEMVGAPDAVMRFGSVWSYLLHGHAEGNINLIADYQEALAAGFKEPITDSRDNDHYEFGEVSSDFFPDPIRRLMLKEIQMIVPQVQNVKFYLYKIMRYAMPQSIVIDLGYQALQDLQYELAQRLTWYMPPYLPVSVR